MHEVYLCCSNDFKESGDSKLALDAYVESACEKNETPLEFYIRQGWEEYIYQMLVVDFLILNRDRHGANMEVLRSRRNKSVHPAPLFDHGLSLLFQCGDDGAAEGVNVMEDKRVNNYIGSQSTWENLRLIPADRMPGLNPLKESDGEIVMKNLDGILSPVMQKKIWEMIWKRWRAYEDFCNSR